MAPHRAAIAGAAVVGLIAVLVGGWFAFLRDDEPYEFEYGHYDPPKEAYPLDLVDQDGKPFSLADHQGNVVLLYFGYTYCPDFCPTTMADMHAVESILGDDAANVDVVMVSVDPERDTPARLKEYLEFYDPGFIGLSGTAEQLSPIKAAYGIFAQPQTPESSQGFYLVDHSTQLYAIDPDGNLRLTWPYGTAPEQIAEDVRHLLHP